MNDAVEQSVELLESNRTLRDWMESRLAEEGFDVRTDASGELADLLVVDVEDSEEDVGERIDAYIHAERPFLAVGLRDSRDSYEERLDGDGAWLNRPYSAGDLLGTSRALLGLDSGGWSSFEEEAQDTAVEGLDAPAESADSEDSGDADELGEIVSDEVVDEMVSAGLDDVGDTEDDAHPVEGEKGEQAATSDETAQDGAREEESSEPGVREIDDASSMVLDVHELDGGFGSGGRVSGDVVSEELDVARLADQAESLESDDLLADPKTNPTLPDVPEYRDANEEKSSEESSGIHQIDSAPGPSSGAGSTGARRTPSQGAERVEPDSRPAAPVGEEGAASPARAQSGELSPPSESGGAAAGEPLTQDFERELAEVAGLLAESWSRLGLTARWEDRAERLKRIFTSLVDRGVAGASEELERVPPAHGFSGTLTVFPSFELIRLIRHKGFLGRLEVSNESGGFVLYLDGNRLIGIDDLEGRSGAMLLDCLRQSEAVDAERYEELKQTAEDSLEAPLEMRLQTEELVTEEQLLDARRTRAKWVVKEVLNASSGTFAFIHGGDESGQPWPVNELGLSIDVLLLELLREGKVSWHSNEPVEPGGFVTAGHRIGDEQQTALALTERAVLNFCSVPRGLEEIARELEESVSTAEEIVRRLRAVGFLEPTAVPTSSDQAHGGGGRSDSSSYPSSGGGATESKKDRTRKIEPSGGFPDPSGGGNRIDSSGGYESASGRRDAVDSSGGFERASEETDAVDQPDLEGDTENEALPPEPEDREETSDESSSS